MSDRLDLITQLEQKNALRARLDARVRQESADEPAAAADPVALKEMDEDLERLRHQISALDVEIATEYGASAADLSAWWGQEEGHSGPDHLVLGGYDRLPASLADGLDVRLAWPVGQVRWGADGVELLPEVTTTGAPPAREPFDAVVVSVPLGVLQAGRPGFLPALPAGHRGAIERLGMGLLDKLWVRFDVPVRDGGEIVLSRLAPEGTPYIEWYDTFPLTGEPVLLALVGGRTALRMAALPDDAVLPLALDSLDAILAANG